LLRTDPSTHEGRVYAFRIIEIQGRRPGTSSSRGVPLLEEEQRRERRRGPAKRRRRRSNDRARRLRCASSARSSTWVAACRACCTFRKWGGPACRIRRRFVQARRRDHRQILRVDEDKQKISLGLKQLTADPWSRVEGKYEIGQVCTGRVTRVAEFGGVRRSWSRASKRCARLDIRSNGAIAELVGVGRPGDDGSIRDPEHRPREEADRRRPPAGGLGARPAARRHRHRRSRRARTRRRLKNDASTPNATMLPRRRGSDRSPTSSALHSSALEVTLRAQNRKVLVMLARQK